MTGRVTRLDRSGHTDVTWDTETADAVAEAQRIVDEHLAMGGSVHTREEVLRAPVDVTAYAEVILVPRMVGG